MSLNLLSDYLEKPKKKSKHKINQDDSSKKIQNAKSLRK
jgi:hypothetical protein